MSKTRENKPPVRARWPHDEVVDRRRAPTTADRLQWPVPRALRRYTTTTDSTYRPLGDSTFNRDDAALSSYGLTTLSDRNGRPVRTHFRRVRASVSRRTSRSGRQGGLPLPAVAYQAPADITRPTTGSETSADNATSPPRFVTGGTWADHRAPRQRRTLDGPATVPPSPQSEIRRTVSGLTGPESSRAPKMTIRTDLEPATPPPGHLPGNFPGHPSASPPRAVPPATPSGATPPDCLSRAHPSGPPVTSAGRPLGHVPHGPVLPCPRPPANSANPGMPNARYARGRITTRRRLVESTIESTVNARPTGATGSRSGAAGR
jgi:hypothetical protein